MNWANTVNLAPLFISAVLFIGLAAYFIWPSKPPKDGP